MNRKRFDIILIQVMTFLGVLSLFASLVLFATEAPSKVLLLLSVIAISLFLLTVLVKSK